MRIMTFNCNGIRAAARKGFFDWLPKADADVVCLQETKAQIDQLSDPVFHPEGYHCHYYDAAKKGYSGTALFSREKPKKIKRGLGFELADTEGRYIEADFDGLSVASLYLPSGSSSDDESSAAIGGAPTLRTWRSARSFAEVCFHEASLWHADGPSHLNDKVYVFDHGNLFALLLGRPKLTLWGKFSLNKR